MGSEPMSFSIGMAPESEKASPWATQEKALQEAAWKIARLSSPWPAFRWKR